MARAVNNLSTDRHITGEDLNSSFPAAVRYVAVRATTIPKVVRWLFLLFVFTFPFEATDLGFMTGSLSIAKISGLLFFLFYFFYYGPLLHKRSFPPIPSAMWWFLGYVAVYVFNLPRIAPEFFGDFLVRLLTLLQILAFFWLASDLLKDATMARPVLIVYSIACAIFAVGLVLQVPGFSQEVTPGRITAVGENLNIVGRFMAIAVIVLIHLCTTHVYSGFRRLVLASLALPIALSMVGTGSRGAVVAFVAGMSVYLLPYYKKINRKLTGVIVAALGIVGVIYLIASTPDLLTRWQESYYEGKLAQREIIFAVAMEMFIEEPILGWAPSEFSHMLAFRGGSRESFDTHNVYLHLLLEVGLVGTVPFLMGLWSCLRAGWRGRTGQLDLLPLALLIVMLVGGLSGNTLVWKAQWLVLALTIAGASSNTSNKYWLARVRGQASKTASVKSVLTSFPQRAE